MAQSTQASFGLRSSKGLNPLKPWLALLPAWLRSYTTTTAGRIQAEKHRSARPTGPIRAWLRAAVQAEKHRSALPTGPIQALSQDTASRSTSHDREATGAADSNGSVCQLDSQFITKRVLAFAPVYRALRGGSCAKWPQL